MFHPDMDQPLSASTSTALTDKLKDRVQVLLVTVDQVEWEAVYKKLKPVDGEDAILKVHPNKDAYMIGTFGAYCAALVQADFGARGAQSIVSEAVLLLKPSATIMIGAGFGLNHEQQRLGDVMVSQSLATCDFQRIGTVQSNSLGVVTCEGLHLSPLFKAAEMSDWEFGSSRVHRGLLLSGSKLVNTIDYAKNLMQRYPEAIGGETEGSRVYHACRASSKEWIVVKGISKFPGLPPDKDGNTKEVQRFAAAAATSFVLHALSKHNMKGLGSHTEADGKKEVYWIPEGFPVFVSYPSGLYKNQRRFMKDKGRGEAGAGKRAKSQESEMPVRASMKVHSKTDVGRILTEAGLEKYCAIFHKNAFYTMEDAASIDFSDLSLMGVAQRDANSLLEMFVQPKEYAVFFSCIHEEVGKSAPELFEVLSARFKNERLFYVPGQELDISELKLQVQRSNSMLIVISKSYACNVRCILEATLAYRKGIPIIVCCFDDTIEDKMLVDSSASQQAWRSIESYSVYGSKEWDALNITRKDVDGLMNVLGNSWIFALNSKVPVSEQGCQALLIEEALKNALKKPSNIPFISKRHKLSDEITSYLSSKGWNDLIPLLSASGITDLNSTIGKSIEDYSKLGIPMRYAFTLVEELKSLKSVSAMDSSKSLKPEEHEELKLELKRLDTAGNIEAVRFWKQLKGVEVPWTHFWSEYQKFFLKDTYIDVRRCEAYLLENLVRKGQTTVKIAAFRASVERDLGFPFDVSKLKVLLPTDVTPYVKRTPASTPQGVPDTTSYGQDLNKNPSKVLEDLLDTLRKCGIQAHVSASSTDSKSFSTARVQGAIFFAFVDVDFYLQSKTCMRELKKALESKEVKVLPILLSPLNKYPSFSWEVNKLLQFGFNYEWQAEWKSEKEYLNVVQTIVSLARQKQRCVYEDPSFGIDSLVNDVVALLGPENINLTSHQLQQVTPSLWRIYHPIRECNPAKISDTTVDIHQTNFEKIVQILTSKDKTSVSIAGLKAAGGVGKTVLARRIANCPTVEKHFASEGVLWSEFGQLDSIAQPALERLYRDLGGEETLCFDEDSTGQLMKARESFELLLARRKPRVLLVLDDVWKKKYLQVFKQVIQDTNVKILVTTRFKGMVEEVFGQENSVIDLNTFLSPEDALKMMNKYAGLGSVQNEDVSTMSKIASHFGYHAKALAIVSARFKRFKSWENLLSSVEKSRLKLDGATEAKEWVFAAVKHTLAFALKENPDLIEYYLQLGVLVEGARVSLSDLCVVWNCEIFEATAIANDFFQSSVLETDESPKYDEDAVYYMHDLVRDCARQDKPATDEREKAFVEKLIFNFCNQRDRVTEYTIKHLPQHLSADDTLIAEINDVYTKALDGKYDEKWSNTSFIVMTACENSYSALSNAGVDLCKGTGFLERALNARDDVVLARCDWMKNADVFKIFANALKVTCRLRSLHLMDNWIGDDGIIAIFNGLKENSHCVLEDLVLQHDNMQDGGAMSLSKWLGLNNTLTSLSISWNSIGDEGAIAIGQALTKNKTLKYLSLCNNNIGDIGATEFANCLEENDCLFYLNLEDNNIGDYGATALANALKVNPTLKELYLYHNNIGEAGTVALKPYWNRVSTS